MPLRRECGVFWVSSATVVADLAQPLAVEQAAYRGLTLEMAVAQKQK